MRRNRLDRKPQESDDPLAPHSWWFRFWHRTKVVEIGDDQRAAKFIAKPVGKGLIWFLVVVALFIFSWFFITLPRRTNPGDLFVIIGDLFRPKLAFTTYEQYFNFMWTQAIPRTWETIEMVFISTVIGCLVSIPLFILSSKNVTKHIYIYGPVRVILDIIRTIPTFVLALLMVATMGYNNTSGVIAMTIFTIGIMYKLMYEFTDTCDMAPYEASLSVGATKGQAFFSGLWPNVFPTFLSNCLYTFEINVRASIILGFVGAGGVGKLLSDAATMGWWDQVGSILIPIFVVTMFLQLVSSYTRKKVQ